MAKAKTTTRKTKAAKSKEKQAVDQYGNGCSEGYRLAMAWLEERKRTLPALAYPGLQHTVLDFIDEHQKARGARRPFVRGKIVGFYSTLENPSEATQLELLRLKQESAL